MAGNIIGIVAQRLVRRLCLQCKRAGPADAVERRLLGVAEGQEAPTVYRAHGCEQCGHQGYRGRLAIMELLKLNEELDDLIAHRVTGRALRNAAIENGFRPMAEDGVRRVLEGLTTLDEIARVVDFTGRLA